MKPAILALAIACLAGLPSGSVRADSLQQLATIENDRNADVHTLSLDMADPWHLKAIHVVTTHGDAARQTSRSFSIEDVASPAGAVLDGDSAHKAIILQGRIDGAGGSGMLVVRYIKNGLFGGYGQCQVALLRNDGHWRLYNAYTRQVVTNLTIRTWSLGIRTIEGICPASS